MSRLDRKKLIKLWEEEILPGLIKALNIMHSAARRGYHLELTTHEGDKYDIWEEPANA